MWATLVLSDHLDTVGAGGMADAFEARIVGDRLLGRGASDMKADLAGLVVAAEELARPGVHRRPRRRHRALGPPSLTSWTFSPVEQATKERVETPALHRPSGCAICIVKPHPLDTSPIVGGVTCSYRQHIRWDHPAQSFEGYNHERSRGS
ncbi:MAG: M20/M25/M40 family metallo-hydrolase [Nakamurella sp.]